MLAGQSQLPILILHHRQRQAAVNAHALDVLIQDAVERVQKDDRIGFAPVNERANRGLRHEHQNAAFQAVSGHIADADIRGAALVQHVVIIAADLLGGLHVTDNLHARNLLQFFRHRQHHLLNAAGNVEFRAHAEVLLLQLLVQHVNFDIGFFDLLLRDFQGRDVAGHAERADDFAVFIAQRHFRRQRPAAARVRLFQIQNRLPGADNLLFLLIFHARQLFREKIKIRFAHHFGGITESHARGDLWIRPHNAAVAVFEIHAHGDIEHERIKNVVLPGEFRRALGDALI